MSVAEDRVAEKRPHGGDENDDEVVSKEARLETNGKEAKQKVSVP